MVDNYIDCAIFRKETFVMWGYDENMPYQGFEDWEFWRSRNSECDFHHLDKWLLSILYKVINGLFFIRDGYF
jgi:hypothetical protein